MLFPTDQTVFFVEDDAALRTATVQRLELDGLAVAAFGTADEALLHIDAGFGGVIVSDIRLPRTDGLQLLAEVRRRDPDIPVILVTGHADVPMAVGALRDGAFDFLTKPFAADQLVAAIRRGLEKRLLVLDNRRLRAAAQVAHDTAGPLLGGSAAMVQLRATIRQLAQADLDVLVEGETGTGKELVARLLHREGRRRAHPFVAVNCGALPEALAESELFGHAADTVPQSRLARVGQIEASSGGTLLLDEIDSMALPIQTRLLRVLEEREVQPIGAERPRAVALRVIATSKRPLEEVVAAGAFRSDLFYRLNVVRLRVPPLRERREDVAPLFAAFVDEARGQLERGAFELTEALVRYLDEHDWPGNVRELRNFAFKAVLGVTETGVAEAASDRPLSDRVRLYETMLIENALRSSGGSVALALRHLQLPRKTFYDKVERLGIDLAQFR